MFTNSLRFFKVYLQSVKTKYKSIKIKRLYQQSSLPQNLARPTPLKGPRELKKITTIRVAPPPLSYGKWSKWEIFVSKICDPKICCKKGVPKIPKLWKEGPHLRNTVLFFSNDVISHMLHTYSKTLLAS